MYLNPKLIRENNDKDICIYQRYINNREVPYSSFWSLWVYHDSKREVMWTSSREWNTIPKDGDICKVCGREILIVEG